MRDLRGVEGRKKEGRGGGGGSYKREGESELKISRLTSLNRLGGEGRGGERGGGVIRRGVERREERGKGKRCLKQASYHS